MDCRQFMVFWVSAGFLLTACAADRQLIDQNTVLNTELKHARIELQQAEEKLKIRDAELAALQQTQSRCNDELIDLQSKYAHLKNINLRLSENLDQLSGDLAKKKSLIQLQSKVIRLLDDTKKTIETSLKDEIAAREIELVETKDTLKVVFIDKILFDSGSIEINSKGRKLLLVVAESVRGNKDQKVVVEGHTDNKPLGPNLKAKFPSNWELSTARAAAVVRFLQEKGRLQPERLSARGYSFYRPLASNDTEAGRHQNRRIEIILGP